MLPVPVHGYPSEACNKTKPMDKDTQLPAEVLDKITHEAEVIYNKLDSAARDYDEYEYGLPMFEKCKEPIERALTEYASKLHAARTLLEKVIYRHEGGLLPDRLLYNEIKSFLDGTK